MPVNIADLQPAVESLEIAQRVDAIDWMTVDADLDRYGCARVPGLLSASECTTLASLYPHDALYRSRVVMARHGFGRGEYKYFAYPLPAVIAELRATLYPHLAPIANRWNKAFGIDVRYPAGHAAFLDRCHAAGQTRPTPLILQYGADDYNCLHQDLYGEHVFPPIAILLSAPGRDFWGIRADGTATTHAIARGSGVVDTRRRRHLRRARQAGAGTRGVYRVNLRHGVSRIRAATATRSASSSMTRNDG